MDTETTIFFGLSQPHDRPKGDLGYLFLTCVMTVYELKNGTCAVLFKSEVDLSIRAQGSVNYLFLVAFDHRTVQKTAGYI